MARRFLLDFEKPLVELENQIDQIRELARDSEVDVSQQLLQLETLAASVSNCKSCWLTSTSESLANSLI